MLKLRVLTSILLAPLILWVLLAAPYWGWGLFLGAVVTLGAWEWTTLMQWSSRLARLGYAALLALLVAFSLAGLERNADWAVIITGIAVLFWGWALLEMILVRDIQHGWQVAPWFRPLGGLLVLYPAWLALMLLRLEPKGEWLTFYFLFLVWGADVGAYFAGHQFGRHKLAPSVSPGKTWEGVAGGMVMASLVAVIAGYFGFHQSGPSLLGWIVLALITALVSVLGDLHESRMKRVVGVKDSGTLIPGHGGMLDRIDALTSAAPFFMLAWLIEQHLEGVGG